MQTKALTFDTHHFVKRLTRVGMPEAQAEVLAQGQSDLYERLVTKEDLEQKLKALQLTLENDLAKTRAELKNDIETVRAELEAVKAELKHDIETVRAELETVKAELKHDIETVRADLEQKLSKQEAANRQALKELELTLTHNMKEMEHKLTIKLGAFIAAGVTLLAALVKFF